MKQERVSGISSQNGKLLGKGHVDTETPADKVRPTGPFKTVAGEHEGDLLLFVPRTETGKIVDNFTGRYGYSHLAIDCGEIDVPTGRRVMIEATVAEGVHYGFQDEYGTRPYVRIPLRDSGVNVQQFCECIHARVGEKFDELEAVTLGILDNPARQICSDLATVCLPEAMREEIRRCHTRAALHPLSAVQDKRTGSTARLFMSPNAFAEYFGAPRGKELEGSDQRAELQPQSSKDVGIL